MMQNPFKKILIIFTIILLTPILLLFAHKDGVKSAKVIKQSNNQMSKYQRINNSYINNVKPIFIKKCFDCHGSGNPLPWYAKIPGVKQYIAEDIQDAKKHLDLSRDFPFNGHGSPLNDLHEIEEVVEDGDMPPLRYKIMHWKSGLTPKEKEIILDWVEKSRKVLEKSS